MPYKMVHEIDPKKAVALHFLSEEAFDKANSITVDKANDHEFLFPGFDTIIMDKEDQVLFDELKDQYVEEEVADPDEISQEDLNEVRGKYIFGTG